MKDVSQLSVLVRDHGQFVSVAQRLARDVTKVYYCANSPREFQGMKDHLVGYGLEGIELVDSPFDPEVFDQIDLFVFPDLLFPAEQVHLEKLGKKVWGARYGELLEYDRVLLKQKIEEVGLPSSDYEVVKGTDNLRAFLKENPDVFVKIVRYRGDWESTHADGLDDMQSEIIRFEHEVGDLRHLAEFVVETPTHRKDEEVVEIGYDGWTVDGKFPASSLSGIEIKDSGYIGSIKPYASLPKPVKEVNDALAPLLRESGYKGPMSTEVRVGKDGKPYLIDLTCRLPSPPQQLQQEMYANYTQTIWDAANGIITDPVPVAKYGALLILKVDGGETSDTIEFPKEIERQVKLNNAVFIKGKYRIVPQPVKLTQIGAVIGWGDTLEAAIEMCKEAAEQVKGAKTEPRDLDGAEEELEKSKKLGYPIL
jgi:hypothetical protein